MTQRMSNYVIFNSG